MAIDDEIDVPELLAGVRERLRRNAATSGGAMSPLAERQAAADLAVLAARADVLAAPLPTERRLLGWLVVRVKRALRRLLFPILRRQVEYNEASMRLVWYLTERVAELTREQTRRPDARPPDDRP